jgi:hypothetical protein
VSALAIVARSYASHGGGSAVSYHFHDTCLFRRVSETRHLYFVLNTECYDCSVSILSSEHSKYIQITDL